MGENCSRGAGTDGDAHAGTSQAIWILNTPAWCPLYTASTSMTAFSLPIATAVFLYGLFQSTGSPWDGLWKLNNATVRAIPPPLVIEVSGPHYTLTQGATYHFDCDGRDYQASPAGTLRCLTTTHGIKVEVKRAGQLSSRWELALHADGLTLTNTVTEFNPGVPPSVERDEYRRPAPGNRTIAASWNAEKTIIEGSDALEFRIHDGFLYFRDARDGNVSDSKLDGTPAPFVGTGAPAGRTWSNVFEGDRRIVGHSRRDGKSINTMVFELSKDGRSITVSLPESPSQFRATYEKQ